MANPELKREFDPAWFLAQPNQTEYTKGFYKGRKYEQERIAIGIRNLFDRLAPAHAADGSQPQLAIEEQIMHIVRETHG